MVVIEEIESIFCIQGEKIRFTGGSILKRGITTGWVNKARGHEGWTPCKVYVCYKNKKGEMIAPRGAIEHGNIDMITAESEEARSNSFVLSMLDQFPAIQMEVNKLSKRLAGAMLKETCKPLRKQDLDEFCVLFQSMVVKEMKRQMESKNWRGSLYLVDYKSTDIGFDNKWWE